MGNIQHAPVYRPMTMMSKYKKWKQEICWDSQVVFSSKKRSTSPLVRRDFYRKTIQVCKSLNDPLAEFKNMRLRTYPLLLST